MKLHTHKRFTILQNFKKEIQFQINVLTDFIIRWDILNGNLNIFAIQSFQRKCWYMIEKKKSLLLEMFSLNNEHALQYDYKDC